MNDEERLNMINMLRRHYVVEHVVGWGLMSESIYSNRLPYL